MFLSSWKALLRISALIGGVAPNTAFAMVITPAFWLLRPANANAGVCPRLNWKWIRPIGKTNTSPGFRIREEAVRSVCLVGRHETDQELSLDDDKDFRAAGVSVRRVLAVGRVVDANQLYSESVKAWDSVNIHRSHFGPDIVVSVSGNVEARSEEILSLGKLWVLAELSIHEHCSK